MGRSFMRGTYKGKLFESRFFIYFSECILGKHCISKQVWVAKFVLHWMQHCWKWHLPFSTHKCFLLFFRLQKLKGNVSCRECVYLMSHMVDSLSLFWTQRWVMLVIDESEIQFPVITLRLDLMQDKSISDFAYHITSYTHLLSFSANLSRVSIPFFMGNVGENRFNFFIWKQI